MKTNIVKLSSFSLLELCYLMLEDCDELGVKIPSDVAMALLNEKGTMDTVKRNNKQYEIEY